ncbi:hypothetical protein PBRA_009137, partial [Plasmodiophora brassicae]
MTMLLLCLLLGATTGLICDQDPCAFGGYHCANTYPAANPHNLSVLEVAAVFPFENTNGWTAVYKIAMDDVNDDPGIFPGYLKRIRWMSTRSDATHATAAFLCTTTADTASLLSPPTVPLILHSGYSFEVVAFSTLANLMSLPILSGTASSSSLSDRKAYPLFNRLFPPDNLQGRAIIQIVAHFKWKQICILAASDPASSLLMDALLKEAKSSNVVVVQAMQFDPNTSPEPQLQRILSSGVRIIIAAMLADPVNKVFTAARAMDMVGPDWVWIGSQIWVESPMDPVVPDGVIGCLGYTNVSNPIYKRFYNKWQDLYTSQPNT